MAARCPPPQPSCRRPLPPRRRSSADGMATRSCPAIPPAASWRPCTRLWGGRRSPGCSPAPRSARRHAATWRSATRRRSWPCSPRSGPEERPVTARGPMEDLELAILRNLLAQTTRAYDEKMAQLFAEKEMAQVTLASIGDGVVTTDELGRVKYLNPVAEAMTGWTREDAGDRALDEVFHLVREDPDATMPEETAPRSPLREAVRNAVENGSSGGL